MFCVSYLLLLLLLQYYHCHDKVKKDKTDERVARIGAWGFL